MAKQEYPKALYRQDGDRVLCSVVKTPEEHESAKEAGWGNHPSTRKAEPPAPVSDVPRSFSHSKHAPFKKG